VNRPTDIEPSTVVPSEVLPEDPVEIGQWYWTKVIDHKGNEKELFTCVTHVGSNYVEMTTPGQTSYRIHFDLWESTCRRELNPEDHIKGRIAHYQKKVHRLMSEVKEVTALLGVGSVPALTDGTAAMVKATSDRSYSTYSKDLAKAKEETLPELFKRIENANKSMATWMKASTVPLLAKSAQLKSVINEVEERIFNVELYAGLVESVVQVKDGKTAPINAKVHLLQRRCYMDEECLAQYQTGGMEFKDIRKFDRWLARRENMDRILPFPKCVVAFRVRREHKERYLDGGENPLVGFISIMLKEEADKATFLYIRNGSQLYRLQTAIDFDEKLFPDMKYKLGNPSNPGEMLWAKTFAGSTPDDIITDSEYRSIVEKHEREVKEWKKAQAAYKAAIKSPEAKRRAKEKGLKHPDHTCVDVPWVDSFGPHMYDHYEPYTPDNVNFDDISDWIKGNLKEHNRIALILQGLLDRSPVFHPHPPWQIWTPEGFLQALELVYDETRTLPAGEKPDFEFYRRRLNATLKTGSITVGQEDAWLLLEGEKERNRVRDRRGSYYYMSRKHQPYGNPGPGTIARVASLKRNGRCTFRWQRRGGWSAKKDIINTSFECSPDVLLNVDAYTPGDFKLFFNDPRTRAEYLQWAPLLLEAEEYHAGNRKVGSNIDD